MLKKRFITALWGIPLVTVAIWFGDPYFTVFIGIWVVLAVLEFYRLVAATGVPPLRVFGAVWALLFVIVRDPVVRLALEPSWTQGLVIPALLTVGIVISLFCLLARKDRSAAFPAWAWTWAGILYTGWLLGYALALRDVDGGRNWVFLALLCTFGSDTAAFFVGRAFGKRKLATAISPSKTWEGAMGGLLGAAGVSLLFLLPTPLSLAPQLNWWQAVALGLLVSIFGQLGDLVESLFKRNVGAKDSGRLLPGHGGVLDRMDSVVFALVVTYYWVLWLK